ncbi:MAG: hypothetical protein Q9209_006282 [Squamulea sp. 1 TL-2023]
MAIRGERFHVDIDSDEEAVQPQDNVTRATPRNPWGLVADIRERSPSSTVKPPSPPRFKNSQDGFPVHKKRFRLPATRQASDRTKRSDTGEKRSTPVVFPSGVGIPGMNAGKSSERHDVDMENQQRLAKMSSEDIEQARNEVMTGLTPSLISKLLKKANIEEDQEANNSFDSIPRENDVSQRHPSSKKVNFNLRDARIPSSPPSSEMDDPVFDPEDITPNRPPEDLQPVSTFSGYPVPPQFHFPRPPTPPSLDPEDPEFLSKLHSTYFPSLPSNPNALSWMQPLDPAESEGYSPSLDNLLPSAVRFDFRGRLLPPRLASQIPPTKGLHHHGTAPEAAGYTIPELSHLSRSSFPSQRCIAYQTLGRILYRLGIGVFGPEDHELCQGLWKCIEQGRVLDTLTAEAARDGDSGNRTCWVTATEAVWLWRRGGGRKWKAT